MHEQDENQSDGVRLQEIIGRLLDEDSTGDELAETLTPFEKERIADHQWLDSLLAVTLNPEQAEIDSSVDSVMKRIRSASAGTVEEPVRPMASRFSRFSRRGWGVAVASTLMMGMAGILFWASSSSSAWARVNQACLATLKMTDRTYRVVIDSSSSLLLQGEGRLTVRGGENYVFELTGQLGHKLRAGRSSENYWVISPLGDVILSTEPMRTVPWLNRRPTPGLPYLQLSTLVDRLDPEFYQLEQLDDERVGPNSLICHHFKATLRRGVARHDGHFPTTIELWIDQNTDSILLLEAIRQPLHTTTDAQKILIELIEEGKQPDEIYRYQTYIDSAQLPE